MRMSATLRQIAISTLTAERLHRTRRAASPLRAWLVRETRGATTRLLTACLGTAASPSRRIDGAVRRGRALTRELQLVFACVTRGELLVGVVSVVLRDDRGVLQRAPAPA